MKCLITKINVKKKRTIQTYHSITGRKNGMTFSIPSILARDCTNAIGIMKKKVRKKSATAIRNLLIVSSTKGMERLDQ